MVIVLDDLFGLPVTSGASGAGDVLCRLHYPLESLAVKGGAVKGGAVAVPGGNTARQDALDCASVKFV